MKAVLVVARNPFEPASADRRVLRRRRRVRALAPRLRLPVVAFLNGRPLPRAAWRRRIADGDHLAFVALPLDGGGQGGSDPIRTILSLALVVVAGPLGTLVGGALGIKAGIAQAAILFGGNALLNALLPPPTIDRGPAADPVFALTPQGNAARLEQPIPVHYGRLRVQPDFAAAPWAETAGNEQFLYCLYCLGAGDFEIEDIRIGDVTVANFGEVDVEIVPPGGQVTLFPTAVETSALVAGQELRARADLAYTRSGTTLTVSEPKHGRASGQTVRLSAASEPVAFAAVGTIPDEDTWTVTVAGWTAASGTVAVETVLGGETGFPASGSGTTAATLGVDLVWPAGLYASDAQGRLAELGTTVRLEARRISADAAPLGPWTLLGEETLREGLYHAAANRYRRRIVRFATEMEGFVPAPGDLVAVQHDLVGWGAAAEAVAWDAAARRLVVSEPLDWSGSGHVIGLRRRDGSLAGPFDAARGASDREAVLAGDPGFAPDTGQGRLRTTVAFGRASAWSALAKIVAVRPRDALTVEIEAVVEDPAVHVAETGRTPRPLRLGRLPRLADAPVVAELAVVLSPDAVAFLSWTPAPGATHYEVEIAEGGIRRNAPTGWTRAAETAAASVTLRPPYGPRTAFRVRAVGRSAGPWAQTQAGVARPIVWRTRDDASLEFVWTRRAGQVAWLALTDTVWTNIGAP